VALSSHRLDVIERVFSATQDSSLLEWVLQLVVREGVISGSSRAYKNEVLHLLIKLFSSPAKPDYFSITQCFVYLNDPALASSLLAQLLHLSPSDPSSSTSGPTKDDVLTAYQIGFDLAETATQEFLEVVRSSLRLPATEPEGAAGVEVAAAASGAQDGPALHRERLAAILSGEESIKLYLEFLYRNNHADLLILKGTKDALEARNSIYHSAVSFMNAFANAGTTSDLFLRENLDWLAKASNWSKFSATAALGVIHKGNLAQGKAILEPYLPRADGSSTSFYSEGGSLFALGLVNANHANAETLDYLRNALKAGPENEVIQHGAALGLGVAGMGSGNEDIYEDLRRVLYNDSAIAGEAAGYAMGLVMLGTAHTTALKEMLEYAHETKHEKIIRGLAIGIAFLMYGKEEEADSLIETLLADADAILRYGGIYTIALAYAGTGNNKAIRKLLHVAVSDVNDDVRRAAVTALGFLLFRNPTQVPRIVQLLSESYNPNVRYGAALALGISCAGTGLADAIELLEPLTKDPVDFVRQGACLSLSMILIQQNEVQNPKVGTARTIFSKIIADKHEDGMAKFGAALSQGILDAGGRNVTVALHNKSGSNNMAAIVGMALFTQFWYWFPLAHCLSLAFTPTAIIGVTDELRIPKLEFLSHARPALFAYPPATKPPAKEVAEKVATAVLSTTAKATARAKAKEKEEKGDEAMETEDVAKADGEDEAAPKEGEAKEKAEVAPAPAKPKRKEGPEKLANLSRVTPSQLAHISFPAEGRYIPIRSVVGGYTQLHASTATTPAITRPATPAVSTEPKPMAQASSVVSTWGTGGGILLLRDNEPDKEGEFLEFEVSKVLENEVEAAAAQGAGAGAAAAAGGPSDAQLLEGEIAAVPEPFEWADWE